MAYLFPYTAVPPLASETLLNLFDELVVLQPTTDASKPPLGQTGSSMRLKFICPFETGHEKVKQAVSAYTKWAEQHGGTDLKQIRIQLDRQHFFDDESSYQLGSLIRPSEGQADSLENIDLKRELLNSRVFLNLAQAFDVRNWEMEGNLDRVEASEDRLFAHLHGRQPEADTQLRWEGDTQSSYMMRERMAAWSFFLTQPEMTPGVLVTLSPEVKPLIEEAVPAKDFFYTEGWVIPYDDATTQSQWRQEFKTALDPWLTDPAREQDLSELLQEREPADKKGAHVAIYRVRDFNPIRLLGRAKQMWDQTDNADSHSVVVLVQF